MWAHWVAFEPNKQTPARLTEQQVIRRAKPNRRTRNQKDREVNNMKNHLKEKDESSKKIISCLRNRMQSDIDKIERRTIQEHSKQL